MNGVSEAFIGPRPVAVARALISLTLTLASWLSINGLVASAQGGSGAKPNVVIINIDDMGWGDFGAYGSSYSSTPNIDQLAAEGTRLTQFYTGSPLCSSSRASLFTGQFSARSGINSFIDSSTANYNRDMENNLSLDAPSMARAFQDGGYATGHFGKWHLGGGRDVGYAINPTPGTNASAPRIVEYGYDDAWTQMEGLGNRIINVQDYGGAAAGTTIRPSAYMNGLNQASDARGTGGGLDQIVYLEREYNGVFMMDRTLEFIQSSVATDPDKPFFVNYWADEVHTPHDPSPALKAKYDVLYPNLTQEQRNYLAVLEGLDQQIGRLVNYIDQAGLGGNTLFLVTADNGAEGGNASGLGSNGPFRGTKGDLFEGGVRAPLIARWTGHVAANRTDDATVMSMPDLFPTLTSIAGLANPAGVVFDGEDLSDALLGNASQTRTKSIFWNMNRGTENRHANPNSAGAGAGGQEVIALRTGNWKLLLNAQGTAPELYDLAADPGETNNLAFQQPGVVSQMAAEALSIRYSTPSRNLPDAATPVVRLKADDLKSLGNGAAVGSWSDSATGDSFNGTVTQANTAARPTLITEGLNGRAVLNFDGDDLLASSTTNSLASPSQGITVFAVTTSDGSGETAERLGQFGASSGAAGQVVGFDVSSTSKSTDNGGAGFRFNNGAALYDTPLANPGFHIVAWQVEPGQAYSEATMYVGGTLSANTFTGSATATGSLGLSGNSLELLLGSGRGANGTPLAGDYFTGQLAEFIVYNEQLSIGQINLVANYLSNEYGLPFAYETALNLYQVDGLAWTGGMQNFDAAWNAGDGNGGLAGSMSNPFASGKALYLGNGGVAVFDNSTNVGANASVNSLFIGSARSGFIVAGADGDGALVASGSRSLTIGNGAAPAAGTTTGDLYVGSEGRQGTLAWNSTGTLKIEGRLRVGEGGTGVFQQNAGTVTAGDVAGSLKFIAIGSGAGSDGEYLLNAGSFLPGGGPNGSQLRHLRVGYAGGTGVLRVGDGVGAANSASVASRDDLYVGYDGGDGTLLIATDGSVVLQSNEAPVFIGLNAGSRGLVQQTGGRFQSDGVFSIGEGNDAWGRYEINGGTLTTAADGAGRLSVGRNGGEGSLAVGGTATVLHQDALILGDGAAGTSGRLELVGSAASLSLRKLENLPLGAAETIAWIADADGVTPLTVLGGLPSSGFVQLQNPAERNANTGVNGGPDFNDLRGDGTALLLDLSALSGSQTLTLIDNLTSEAVIGFFENGATTDLYEEGETIFGTGFTGTVTISYLGGTGNDVVLNLVAGGLPGDFNNDGVVDAADYTVYRDNLDTGFDLGGNGDETGASAGVVDAADYALWTANYGATAPTNLLHSVPEPLGLTLVGLGIATTLGFYRRR